MPDFVVNTLGGVVIAVITAAGTTFATRQARGANRSLTDAQWNAAYRAGAEAHMPWDYARREDIQQLRRLMNELRQQVGLPPIEFDEIPEPPPLFPKTAGAARAETGVTAS